MSVVTRATTTNNKVTVAAFVKTSDMQVYGRVTFDSIATATDCLLSWASRRSLGPSARIQVRLPRVLAVPLGDKLATWMHNTDMVAHRRQASTAIDLADASTFSLVKVLRGTRTKVRATGSHRFNTVLVSAALHQHRIFVDIKPTVPVGEVQLFVKTLSNQTVTVRIALAETMGEMKLRVQRKVGIAPDQQRLIFGGRGLNEEGTTLEEYGVTAEQTLHLLLRLRGGMFVEANGRDNNSELEAQAGPELVTLRLAIAGEKRLSISVPVNITVADAMQLAQAERAQRAAEKRVQELKDSMQAALEGDAVLPKRKRVD
jgi:hypothetical protein